MEILNTVYNFFQQHTELAALMSAGAAGGLIVSLKSIPIKIFNWLVTVCTTTVSVTEDAQPIFDDLVEWLGSLGYTQKARSIRLIHKGQRVPGFASHIIWYKWRPMLVTLMQDEAKGSSIAQRRYRIIITMPGRSHALINSILGEIEKKEDKNLVNILTFHGHYWGMAQKKTKRNLSSIFLPQNIKTQLVNAVTSFVESSDKYHRLNIPYRFGLLLSGKPGTGKTTLAFVLAGLLGKPIYYVGLGSILSDKQLLDAISIVDRGSIVLIEDVDTFSVTKKRQIDHENPQLENAPSESKEEFIGITLSGLLNAIDGVIAPEGRILILTTNHPEKLDPALIRKGRIDLSLEFNEMEPEEAVEMYKAWFPEGGKAEEVRAISERHPLVASSWQDLFLRHKDDHDGLFEELTKGVV